MIVLGFDGLDPRPDEAVDRRRAPPGLPEIARAGRGFPASRNEPAAPDPGRLVQLHHRHGPGRPRHLRFLQPRPEDLPPRVLGDRDDRRGRRPSASARSLLPLSGGQVRNLRKGRAFWQILEEHEHPGDGLQDAVQLPSRRDRSSGRSSGMGTPDLKGSYGIFNYYTNAAASVIQEAGGGGRVHDGLRHRQPRRSGAPRPGQHASGRTLPRRPSDFQVFIDPDNAGSQDRRSRAANSSSGERRVERLEARPLRPHPDPERLRHLPVLPQGGPAEVQALRRRRSTSTRPDPALPISTPGVLRPRSSSAASAPSSPRACRPTRAPSTTTSSTRRSS